MINTGTTFIHVNGVAVDTRNNNTTYNVKLLSYQDEDKNNYRLKETSPLIDAGCKIINGSFSSDFYGDVREQGFGIDIGPSESCYYKISASVLISETAISGYPNPLYKEASFTVVFTIENPGFYSIKIIGENGKEGSSFISDYYNTGVHQVSIPAEIFQRGLNIIQCAGFKKSRGLVVVKE